MTSPVPSAERRAPSPESPSASLEPVRSPSPQSPVPSPDPRQFLIVRLGSLGDVVHGLPAAAALREAFPQSRIDWLVDRRNADILRLVPVIDRLIVLERPTLAGWIRVVRDLRRTRYHVAIDLQGLLKSAALARLSGARRVIGFDAEHVREPTAEPFYSETINPGLGGHVVFKNLALLRACGIADAPLRFPLQPTASPALAAVERDLADAGHSALAGGRPGARFALINPGAAWPNKRWSPSRFGAVASFLYERHAIVPIVLWGPGEESLARAVADASSGHARVAPATTIADLVELSRAAVLMVSGDTGPLHIAAAVGTPTVSLFGPTDPRRNGPWSPEDEVVTRHAECECHYERRCDAATWCLGEVEVEEVTEAIERRLRRNEHGIDTG